MRSVARRSEDAGAGELTGVKFGTKPSAASRCALAGAPAGRDAHGELAERLREPRAVRYGCRP
jgi:hypothetical protein